MFEISHLWGSIIVDINGMGNSRQLHSGFGTDPTQPMTVSYCNTSVLTCGQCDIKA